MGNRDWITKTCYYGHEYHHHMDDVDPGCETCRTESENERYDRRSLEGGTRNCEKCRKCFNPALSTDECICDTCFFDRTCLQCGSRFSSEYAQLADMCNVCYSEVNR